MARVACNLWWGRAAPLHPIRVGLAWLLGLGLCLPIAGAQAQGAPPPAEPPPQAPAEATPPAEAPTAPEAGTAPEPAAAPEAEAEPAAGPGTEPEAAPEPEPEPEAAAEPAAEPEPEPAKDRSADFPEGPLPEGLEEREPPDFDGRGEPGTSFGEGALWVPRILFSPLYLVSEYVIRVPLGALVTAAEEGKWLAILSDFFTFDDEQKVGLVPTAYLEFDLQPSVGLYFFADDAFVDDNAIRVHGAMWPDDWWALTVLDRISSADGDRQLSLRAGLLIRPDYMFHGLGPTARGDDESRFQSDTYEAEVLFDASPWRASAAHWGMGLRKRTFSTDTDFEFPNIQQAIDDPGNQISELPPGFEEGYTVWRNELSLSLDTRQPFPAPGHGVRLEVRGEHAFDVEEPLARRWVKYGGAAGGFVDIADHRVIALSVDLDFTDPIEGEVPFTELVTLGGQPPMQGFQEGRLFDRSSAVATFEYRWPVWIWLDMSLHYAVGNVFGAHLDGFETDLLRSSFGLGLRSARTSKPDHTLNLLLAFGTETFEDGHGIDTVRFAVGGTSGF